MRVKFVSWKWLQTVIAAMGMAASSWAAEPTVLRVSVSTAWNLPIAQVEDDRLRSGILMDLYQAIGQKTGLPIAPVVLPRKRIDGAVARGAIDLRCHIHPKWMDSPDNYAWSKPLFTLRDVLFAHEGTPALESIAHIPAGTPISTTLGYAYPKLDALFADGRLRRDDAVEEEKVLLKMTADRTPYGLVNSLALDWYRKKVPDHKLAPWVLEIDSQPIHCAAPKNAAVAPARTLAVIEELRKSGRIDAILRAYR